MAKSTARLLNEYRRAAIALANRKAVIQPTVDKLEREITKLGREFDQVTMTLNSTVDQIRMDMEKPRGLRPIPRRMPQLDHPMGDYGQAS